MSEPGREYFFKEWGSVLKGQVCPKDGSTLYYTGNTVAPERMHCPLCNWEGVPEKRE